MWILVADASRARFFEGKRTFSAPDEFEFGPLELIDKLSNEDARARNQDLETDRPGRFHDRTGSGKAVGGKSGWEPAEEPKTHEARAFAKRLAERVGKGLHEGHFDELVVAAPPKFLGLYRDAASTTLEQATICEIGKDLTKTSAHELCDRLPDLMTST
ncbi:MAG: host attachment protein [Persicimonas sp.]